VIVPSGYCTYKAAGGALNSNPANEPKHRQTKTVFEAASHQKSRRCGNRQCGKRSLPYIVVQIFAPTVLVPGAIA
jgi:hypothetical protein